MKKFLLLALVAVFGYVHVPASALSCMTPLPTFETMYADAQIAFRGTVTDATFVYDNKDEQYCKDMGNQRTDLGKHTFTFSVHEELKGDVASTTVLTHTVDALHCTR
jgi:hypothetical protein